jgi:hypothetical protein
MDRDPHPGVPPDGPDARLSEAEARRVLARAAERERAWSAGVPVARLRDAAVEAGISAAAFDAALAEARLRPAAGPRAWRRAVAAVLGVALVFGAGVAAVQRGGAGAVPSAPPAGRRTARPRRAGRGRADRGAHLRAAGRRAGRAPERPRGRVVPGGPRAGEPAPRGRRGPPVRRGLPPAGPTR